MYNCFLVKFHVIFYRMAYVSISDILFFQISSYHFTGHRDGSAKSEISRIK